MGVVSTGFVVISAFVFLQWAWGEFKRDVLGVKTYYRWDELEALDKARAEKNAARWAAVKKFFGK